MIDDLWYKNGVFYSLFRWNLHGRERRRHRRFQRIAAASIADAVRSYTTDALGQTLDDAGVPNAPLLTVDRVAEHPQTRALDMTVCCEGDSLELMGIPLTFDGARPRARAVAPKLGQHNALLKAARKGNLHARRL
jgi:crotonobetainyl-CoA:carnitine CoA-transferase CaiB-like acyl-CoA transferase